MCKRVGSPKRIEDFIRAIGGGRLKMNQFFDLLQLTIPLPSFDKKVYFYII